MRTTSKSASKTKAKVLGKVTAPAAKIRNAKDYIYVAPGENCGI